MKEKPTKQAQKEIKETIENSELPKENKNIMNVPNNSRGKKTTSNLICFSGFKNPIIWHFTGCSHSSIKTSINASFQL